MPNVQYIFLAIIPTVQYKEYVEEETLYLEQAFNCICKTLLHGSCFRMLWLQAALSIKLHELTNQLQLVKLIESGSCFCLLLGHALFPKQQFYYSILKEWLQRLQLLINWDDPFKLHTWRPASLKCNLIFVNISSITLPNIVRPSAVPQPVQKSTRTVGISTCMWMSWTAPSAVRYLNIRAGSSFITPGQAFKTTTL